MRFIANLRSETIDSFGLTDLQPSGYLLSAHRVTQASLRRAGEVRALGLDLLADNGTNPLIDQVVKEFGGEAAAVSAEVKAVRRTVGRVPRGEDVPATLRRRASALARRVVDRCVSLSEAIDADALLAKQLSMNPTHLIAQEDFGATCLVALQLEREVTGWRVEDLDRRNRRTLRLYERVTGDARVGSLPVYAVLSAVDYNTARSAGRMAAQHGVSNVAMGIASMSSDATVTDFFVIGTASFGLAEPAPRRYLRLAQVARGIFDGYADARSMLQRFHALGLGSPTLFPVLAAVAGDAAVTTDATSPIHDAVRDSVVYDPDDLGARATLLKIVRRILVQNKDWPFHDPFCQGYRAKFGHDPDAARTYWQGAGQPATEEKDLRTPGSLSAALPLFCRTPDEPGRSATRTHIAHNHVVLGDLALALGAGPAQRATAARHIEALIAQNSSLPVVAGLKAVQLFLDTASAR